MIGPASRMYLISVAFTGGEVRRGVFDDASVFLHPVTEAATGRRGLLLGSDLQKAGDRQAALPGGLANPAGEFLGSVERERWHLSIAACRKANGNAKSSTPGEWSAPAEPKAPHSAHLLAMTAARLVFKARVAGGNPGEVTVSPIVPGIRVDWMTMSTFPL